MEESDTSKSDLTRRFQNYLNSHGHGFHYSVLAEIKKLADTNESSWIFEATELPVRIQGQTKPAKYTEQILLHKRASAGTLSSNVLITDSSCACRRGIGVILSIKRMTNVFFHTQDFSN